MPQLLSIENLARMKIRYSTFTALVIGCLLATATPVVSQSEQKTGQIVVPIKIAPVVDDRPAQALYEDANGYLGKAYAEFNRQKLVYDAKLEAKTKQEQKNLALYNADMLAARKDLRGDDLYYLGMLRHLAGDSDATLEVMRRFLAQRHNGEKPQVARAVLVLHAIKKNLPAEAEATVAAYRKAEPIDFNELYGMEVLLTDTFNKAKDYKRMASHARGILDVAKHQTETKQVGSFKRDERLFKGSSLLADALVKLNQQEAAIAVLEDLLKLSVALPSGNLYKMARFRLAGLNPEADPSKVWSPTATRQIAFPPEIIAGEWIDTGPKKLLIFAVRCPPGFLGALVRPLSLHFPKTQRWHESYKDKGLVILGLTHYFGHANGRKVTDVEEIAFLKDFKKKNRLPYGFAIANSPENDRNYGISSIPMSFLIDRNGKVRFISVGANDQETEALGKMIKQLLEESVTPAQQTGRDHQ